MKQTVEEEAQQWGIDHESDETSIGYRSFHAFQDGAAWQKEVDIKIMQQALTYLADLNGSGWIKPLGPGEIDMIQRAKSLQSILYKHLNPTK